MKKIILELIKQYYVTQFDETTFNVIITDKIVMLDILQKYPDLISAGSFTHDNMFVGIFQYLPKS